MPASSGHPGLLKHRAEGGRNRKRGEGGETFTTLRRTGTLLGKAWGLAVAQQRQVQVRLTTCIRAFAVQGLTKYLMDSIPEDLPHWSHLGERR